MEHTTKYYGTTVVAENFKIYNSVEIKKGTKIPVSTTKHIHAWHNTTIILNITESNINTTDMKYVSIMFKAKCVIPETTYPGGYGGIIFKIIIDECGVLKCEFQDGKTGTVLPHEITDPSSFEG